jgi:hypothetical protein
MNEISLTPEQAWNATYIFLRDIWNQKEDKIEKSRLESFLSFASCRFEEDYDWRRSFFKMMGKTFSLEEKILPNQAFLILTEVVSKYQKKYGFLLASTLDLLQSMHKFSESRLAEKDLWQKALEKGLAGRKWGLPDFLYQTDLDNNAEKNE